MRHQRAGHRKAEDGVVCPHRALHDDPAPRGRAAKARYKQQRKEKGDGNARHAEQQAAARALHICKVAFIEADRAEAGQSNVKDKTVAHCKGRCIHQSGPAHNIADQHEQQQRNDHLCGEQEIFHGLLVPFGINYPGNYTTNAGSVV